ncbi:MAG: metal-dependent hydrolase [Desulfobacterales bacterium]|nr:metal-dependent hydrolase [Desulfobacterales bacterium]MDD4071913.1 metal-dependent hydrolase [Desulfobacterales bacterium]MDD4393915.1 metal-dependent hydrolase [Desulfobacterales bacterium]
MADFKTHLTVTSIFSSIATTVLLASSMATPQEVLLYFTMGVIGGLLPDIDSDASRPVRLLFTFMATVIAFLVMFKLKKENSAVELFLVWLASFIAIKIFVFSLFTKITIHRGMIHSIPASVLFGFITTIILHRIFHFGEFAVWMAGLFVFSGYILHLLLDEFSSLTFSGRGPKRSAGTALKFGNPTDLKTTALVYVAVIILFSFTPDHRAFFTMLTDASTYDRLEIFPHGKWFSDLYTNYLAGLK